MCTLDHLIISILARLDMRALVAAAQVNHQWSEHSLKIIWRDLPSILPLFDVLATLRLQSSPEAVWVTQNDISETGWRRLAFYDSKVLSLSHNDNDPFRGEVGPISPQLCSSIVCRNINRREFLPKLQRISWRIEYEESFLPITMALNSNVRKLDLTIAGIPRLSPKDVLDHLHGRTRNIERLSINLSPPAALSVSKFQNPLINLLSTSPNITSIFLPRFYLSRLIVKALGALPSLNLLGQSDSGSYKTTFSQNGCRFYLESQSFPKLESLCFDMSLSEATTVIRAAPRTNNLKSLSIGTRNWATNRGAIYRFLCVLVSAVEGLESLSLNLFVDSGIEADPLYCDVFLPLQSIHLKHLIVGYNHYIPITADDIDWMSSSWPTLHTLSLTRDPVVPDPLSPPDGLNPTELSLFAHRFPNLKTLGVYVVIKPEFQTFSSEFRFRDLQSLHLGTSVLVDCNFEAIASFLASLMPYLGMEVKSGASVWSPQADATQQAEGWDKVCSLIPNFYRAQLGFREIIEELREQVSKMDQSAEVSKRENSTVLQEKLSLESEKSELEEQSNVIKEENLELERKLSDLQNKADGLESENLSLKETIASLNQSLAELEEERKLEKERPKSIVSGFALGLERLNILR